MHARTASPSRKITSPHPPRGSSLAGGALGLLAACLVALLSLGHSPADQAEAAQSVGRLEAAAAGLTDPALFNEASYARNGGLGDPQAAFQDHPMALEHFPAGSLMPPPARARLD